MEKKKQEKTEAEKSFLYLAPTKVRAAETAKILEEAGFAAKQIEVWDEVNLLELTLENGSLYMEDFEDCLRGEEDRKRLYELGMEYVYAVTYPAEDSKTVQSVMEKLLSVLGGKLASDTEDFTPFLLTGEL